MCLTIRHTWARNPLSSGGTALSSCKWEIKNVFTITHLPCMFISWVNEEQHYYSKLVQYIRIVGTHPKKKIFLSWWIATDFKLSHVMYVQSGTLSASDGWIFHMCGMVSANSLEWWPALCGAVHTIMSFFHQLIFYLWVLYRRELLSTNRSF